MDYLSDILKTISLNSAIYFEKSFCGSWGMKMEQSPYGQFHAVTSGSCLLKLEDKEQTTLLSAGDIIFFPFGRPHSVSDPTGTTIINGHEVYDAHQEGREIFSDGVEQASLICGHFEFDRTLVHPFIESLSDFIYIRANDPFSKLIMNFVREISQENERQVPGHRAVIRKLAEILFIQIVRSYALNSEQDISFLKVLSDRNISRALDLIHAAPEKNWNIDSLVKESGLSRTSFINKFSKLVGLTPIQYLSSWRLLKGKQLIESTALPIFEIGEKVGYNSEVSFSRAFKRHFNISPGKARTMYKVQNNRI